MSEAKHTAGELVASDWYIEDCEGNPVAETSTESSDDSQDIANAAEIARRWNCHEELVKACKLMVNGDIVYAVELARAALAKAEAKRKGAR